MENKNNGFLPDGYKAPEGAYYKLKDGENTFRILSSAVTGYEYWNKENKPIRSSTPFQSTPADIKLDDKGKATSIKHFWIFVVTNEDNQIQIMEITQKSIQSAIRSLVENPKWGDPKGYDITINKAGNGLSTEFSVMPNPHSEAPKIDISHINLKNMLVNEDPFGPPATESVEEVVKKLNKKEI